MRPVGHGKIGFTLIELLSVIAILSVLMGVLSYGVFSGSGRSLDGAVRLAGAQFAIARNLAVREGVQVRVLVHNDPSEPDRLLRVMKIVKHQPSTGSLEWQLAGEHDSSLPEGYYFVPHLAQVDRSGGPDTMEWSPRSHKFGGEDENSVYYYFEYNSVGDFIGGDMQFLVEPGTLLPDGDTYSVVSRYGAAGERDRAIRGGFRILRWGGLLYYPNTP